MQYVGCVALCSLDIDDKNKKTVAAVTHVVVPPFVTSIKRGAFRLFAGLISVVLPDSVTSIAEGAFNGCKLLVNINIPTSVASIGKGAFCGCSGLKTIAISASVINVGKHAFADCTALTKVHIAKPKRITILDGAFFGCTSLEHPPPQTKNGCWTCTKYAAYHPQGNKCEGCYKARYCSKVCQVIGRREHGHCEECGILQGLTASGVRKHVWASLRYPPTTDAGGD